MEPLGEFTTNVGADAARKPTQNRHHECKKHSSGKQQAQPRNGQLISASPAEKRTGKGVKRADTGEAEASSKRHRSDAQASGGRQYLQGVDETERRRIEQRQKQIDFGKNTIGYDNYRKAVPKARRERGNPMHPRTPNRFADIPKKRFDTIIRSWRRALHLWDKGDPAHAQKETGGEQLGNGADSPSLGASHGVDDVQGTAGDSNHNHNGQSTLPCHEGYEADDDIVPLDEIEGYALGLEDAEGDDENAAGSASANAAEYAWDQEELDFSVGLYDEEVEL